MPNGAWVLGIGLWVFGTPGAVAQDDPAQDDKAGVEFFEKRIRPVLVDRCYRCHSVQAGKTKNGLALDTRAGIRLGGMSGPAVVPGDPGQSVLVRAIQHQDESLKMPPDRKLTDRQVADFIEWIRRGAPDPRTVAVPGKDASRAAAHWAFKAPVDRPPPAGPGRAAGGNAIDAFVRAALRAKGLTPAPPADRRTLVRRVTFDLLGLPPTADEVDAFVSDVSPDAWEKVVDRLLGSPHYGEHWGRHWLDVARYSDTKGVLADGEDRRFPYAYTYRDWVIRAFNEDLPYDRFIVNQLAADRLSPPGDTKDLAALGFLTVGKRFMNDLHEIIDDRVDVVTRGTMALTVSCARCHDHKYDPVPTQDYYSLAGVFAASPEPGEYPQIGPASDAGQEKVFSAELHVIDGEIAAFLEKQRALVPEEFRSPGKLEEALDLEAKKKLTEIRARRQALLATHPGSPPRAMVVEEADQPPNPRVLIRGDRWRVGEEVPRRFLAVLSGPDRAPFREGSGRLELARAIAGRENPLTARVWVNRVWQHHFGQGLVRTSSDFGLRGEAPSHPELLDWLALRFIGDGWSTKQLHRRILLSDTWQQSWVADARALKIDPDNRLLWRMNRRRLEFEPLRDSLLVHAGTLDRSTGGRPVDILKQPFPGRRSVYAFVDRSNLPEVFRTFDVASPEMHSGARFQTTIPQQALFFMNSPFVVEMAGKTATRLDVMEAPDVEARIRVLYRVLFSRDPGSGELAAGLEYLKAEDARGDEKVPLPVALWSYGYGEVDSEGTRVVSFTPFPHFTGDMWCGGPKLPDAHLGHALLNAWGGHPGVDGRHAAIRRWTAPRDGVAEIRGTLRHASDQGDGVRGRIVSSRRGGLGSWEVHHGSSDTTVTGVQVKRGDTLDFAADPRTRDHYDGFEWAPVVTLNGAEFGATGGFGGPPPPPPPPLSSLGRYVQVLLMTNETVFVD